jgi:acetylornithine deacetylase
MVEAARLIGLVGDLVRIESINPALVPGGSGEGAIARFVARLLRDAGIEARLEEPSPGRFNVAGILRGLGGGPALMLNGHLDTVGVAGMTNPFSGRVEGGRLYGRGALDMKGGVAAALAAMEELARGERLKGDVIFAGVADEEDRSLGTRALLESVRADAAIVMEPTNLEVATAHKGFAWAEIETRGRAAHGSRPEEGLDAIVHMGHVLRELEELAQRLQTGPAHPLLGKGSVHASLIQGGQELSSYPELCRLSVERRLVPPENVTTFEAELRALTGRVAARDTRFGVRFEHGYWARPLELAREHPWPQLVLRAARRVLGASVKFGAASFWTDAALLDEAGIPTVLFGPGGAGLHSTEEYVDTEDVLKCSAALVEVAREFCSV